MPVIVKFECKNIIKTKFLMFFAISIILNLSGIGFPIQPAYLIRHLWQTFPPKSLDCSIWVESQLAKRAVLEKNKIESLPKK